MTFKEFQGRLTRRAQKAGLAISAELALQAWTYYELLERWNKKINLTSLSFDAAPEETLDRLLLEPLAAVRGLRLSSGQLMDVGSGSGSPAIPMRLAAPAVRLTMVESKTRKAAFLREATRQLQLADTEVLTARFEELLTHPGLHESMDLVTIRAVRLDRKILLTLQAFLKPGGRLAMFRRDAGPDFASAGAVTLESEGSFLLLESSGARLALFRKPGALTNVPRGTL